MNSVSDYGSRRDSGHVGWFTGEVQLDEVLLPTACGPRRVSVAFVPRVQTPAVSDQARGLSSLRVQPEPYAANFDLDNSEFLRLEISSLGRVPMSMHVLQEHGQARTNSQARSPHKARQDNLRRQGDRPMRCCHQRLEFHLKPAG